MRARVKKHPSVSRPVPGGLGGDDNARAHAGSAVRLLCGCVADCALLLALAALALSPTSATQRRVLTHALASLSASPLRTLVLTRTHAGGMCVRNATRITAQSARSKIPPRAPGEKHAQAASPSRALPRFGELSSDFVRSNSLCLLLQTSLVLVLVLVHAVAVVETPLSREDRC